MRRTPSMAESGSGSMALGAQFSSTCAARLPPGMAQLTASNIRIHRSANCRHRQSLGNQLADFIHGFQAALVVHAGECLAHVERLAVAIELAMIVGGKLRIAFEPPAQQPAASGNARPEIPTFLAFACAKNSPAGRCRKQLKMICTIARWILDRLHASSTRSR